MWFSIHDVTIDLKEMCEVLIFVLFSIGEDIAIRNTYQNLVTYP